MIRDGRIQDAKSIAGLFMARQHLEQPDGSRFKGSSLRH